MRFLFVLACCLFSFTTFAQNTPKEGVRWAHTHTSTSPTHFEITLSAALAKDWHIYGGNPQFPDVDSIRIFINDGTMSATAVQREDYHESTISDAIFDNQKLHVITGKNTWKLIFDFDSVSAVPKKLKVKIEYNAASKDVFLPGEYNFEVPLSGDSTSVPVSLKIPSLDLARPVANFDAGSSVVGASQDTGGGTLFFLGFLGGLLALLTPCVFPMIPLTISFFSKGSTTRKETIGTALLYGFSIVAIYAALSVPFHVLDKLNPNILNTVATSPILNIIFFVLFVVFAMSFFGLFEITLPTSLGDMADSRSRARKRLGIFFMALTLCIVSFSCTGPILGSLLAGSLSNTQGGAMALTWGLLGFGVALALPFTLLAFFPSAIAKLPKSGGWMNTFKVSLGFFELAFALKFLSNADLIWHWGVLRREIFVLIWVVLGAVYALYLFGKISIYGREKNISAARKIWAAVVVVFSMYMALALPKQPISRLTLLSGFAPPEFYSIYEQENTCALGLHCVHSFEDGVVRAHAENKPILLDFTGWACVNCRKMEEHVWSDPRVYNLIKEKFILVSLYVDDREKLPIDQQISGYVTSNGLHTDIVTVGDKWSVFETENFKNNAQPLYAVLTADGELLTTPVGYLPDVARYEEWLKLALKVGEYE